MRRVLSRCFSCKRRQAPVGTQKMADLPLDRVTPDKPSFSFVGADCFGLFYVQRGRSQVKRYGVLFTCLVTRAIHIEVIQTMDTDSFINSLRRFFLKEEAFLKSRDQTMVRISLVETESFVNCYR